MISAPKLGIKAVGECDIRMTRQFDASRDRVFEAMTRPELVKRWLWGPDEWPMVECTIDFRVGGSFRWVWRHTSRNVDMAVSGLYLEIDRPARIVHTELFDDNWTGGEVRVATDFAERAGGTLMTMTLTYASPGARDEVLKSEMADGVQQGYRRLDSLLALETPAHSI